MAQSCPGVQKKVGLEGIPVPHLSLWLLPVPQPLLQQQIVNGLAVWSRNEIGFPMEKQLCSHSPWSYFSGFLHLAATQGTLGNHGLGAPSSTNLGP